MKKKILIAVGVVCSIVLVLMTVIVVMAYAMLQQGVSISVGRYLEGDILVKDNSPITMSAEKGKEHMFEGLTTGDKILVVHGLIMESYPAQTYVKYCFKQEDGDWSDISLDLLEDLASMGWVDKDAILQHRAETCDFEAQVIRTDGGADGVDYPIVTAISSMEELNAYYERYKDSYDLERKDTVYADSTIGFLDACDKYNEEFFEKQQLLLVMLEAGSGSIRFIVRSVGIVEDEREEKLLISIQKQVPEVGTDDMAQWTCLIELEEGVTVENVENVKVLYQRW